MAKANLARVDTVVHHLAAPAIAAMVKEKDTRFHPLELAIQDLEDLGKEKVTLEIMAQVKVTQVVLEVMGREKVMVDGIQE